MARTQLGGLSAPAGAERYRGNYGEGRFVSIDVLKTAAILTVIWIHAFLTLWRPQVGMVRQAGLRVALCGARVLLRVRFSLLPTNCDAAGPAGAATDPADSALFGGEP